MFGGPDAGTLLAAGLISILFAHEMGHYLACRHYRVRATLPYFVPALWIPLTLSTWLPIPLFGTFGAVIRIRDRFPNRRALFDIGIAGPFAGFVVCVPVLFLGLLDAHIEPMRPDGFVGLSLGEPLLFTWAAAWILGPIGPGQTLMIGPLGLAAWFGMLVTALNLFPIGQLDGGHVTYALVRERAQTISRGGSWLCLALVYFGPNWLIWWGLLRFIGAGHPATIDDAAGVGGGRIALAILGALVFVICFIPQPIEWSWAEALSDLGVADWLPFLVS
jgi:membrane-associated protease RseP (regulator of RpoE activity)